MFHEIAKYKKFKKKSHVFLWKVVLYWKLSLEKWKLKREINRGNPGKTTIQFAIILFMSSFNDLRPVPPLKLTDGDFLTDIFSSVLSILTVLKGFASMSHPSLSCVGGGGILDWSSYWISKLLTLLTSSFYLFAFLYFLNSLSLHKCSSAGIFIGMLAR